VKYNFILPTSVIRDIWEPAGNIFISFVLFCYWTVHYSFVLHSVNCRLLYLKKQSLVCLLFLLPTP